MSRLSLALAHQDNTPLSLGCVPCETLGTCGGLHVTAGVWSCDSYCRCTNRDTCSFVCRNKPDEYARREREVNGFTLTNVKHAPHTVTPSLPSFVPLIYGNTGLTRSIPTSAVSIPLSRLFYARTGRPRFRDGRQLRRHFRVGTKSQLVISGVSRDQPIEHYWEHARASVFLDWLAAAKPDLVTVPNFSMFNDVPREDNLHAMKRIAICWQELASRGIPTALHLNGRTERDWERWTEFLITYPEVKAVAFEFATGAAFRKRGLWHSERLARVASQVGRPLTLIVRGGMVHLACLAASFSHVVFLSGTPYLKTMKRKRLIRREGQRSAHWVHHQTTPNEPLNTLLEANILEVGTSLADLLG